MGWTGKAEKAQRQARRAVGEPIEYHREGFETLKFQCSAFIDTAVRPVIFDGMVGSLERPECDVTISLLGLLVYPENNDDLRRVDTDTLYYVSEIHPDGEGEVNLQLTLEKS